MNDSSLIIFKAISNFVNNLESCFGEKQRSLVLYNHLIKKTTIVHEEPIRKHISSWKIFYDQNKEAILANDYTKFTNDKVKYSDKVFIDLTELFQLADEDEKTIMWRHILNISAYLDPSSKAKKILKDSMKSKGKEAEFLTSIIDQVEQHVDPASNPMEAVGKIMGSGIFQNLVQNMNTGLTDGSLDLGRLMGSVNSMVSSLGAMQGASGMPPEMSQMTNMLNSMMTNIPETKKPQIEIAKSPIKKSKPKRLGK